MGAVNNYAGPIGVHAWANQEHGGTNLGETVPLSPAPLATKETSGIGQCCQRLEPLPALRQERRQRRHSRNESQVGGPEQGQMRRGQNLKNGSQQQHERGVRKDSSYSRGCAGTTEADLSQNEARAYQRS